MSSIQEHQLEKHLNDYLIIIDIDYFKKINDRYGHMIGDEVLVLFARLLVDNTRPQDSVFRTGGEEFVIFTRQLSHEDATHTCERLRKNIEKNLFPQAGGLTISIGFSQIEYPVNIYHVLKKADRALYYAKEHGRNMVCSYETLLEENKIEPVTPSSDIIDIW
jgi:diguanylate cyclase (GGDEF)-like protein